MRMFLPFIWLLLLGSRGNGELVVKESPLLCDAAMWKTGKDLPLAAQLADAWCDATAIDAVRQAMEARDELAASNAVKDWCRDRLKSCQEDRSSQQQECDREKMELEAGFMKSLAEVAYWKKICEKREDVAFASCKVDADRSLVEVTSGDSQVEFLDEALASCRLRKAYDNATLEETVKRLKEKIRRLYVILIGITGVFFIALSSLLIYNLLGGSKGGKIGKQARRTIPVLSPAQTVDLLDSMRDEDSGCTRSILTSSEQRDNEFFMLVPLNCFRRRKYALFGCGGDYFMDAKLAKDQAAAAGKPLSIVLYDHNGHAFSQSVLESLGMRPQEIAAKVVPKDCDYPSRLDILVLWVSYSGEVFLTNADGHSILTDQLAQQQWVTYLCR